VIVAPYLSEPETGKGNDPATTLGANNVKLTYWEGGKEGVATLVRSEKNVLCVSMSSLPVTLSP